MTSHKVLTLEGAGYPKPLCLIHQPPERLTVRGGWLPEDAAAVAVVGMRDASHAGLENAQRLGFELAQAGVTVVSGLAREIDAAAHRGALKAGGRTIAVLGSGLMHIYPPEHLKLAEEIASHGAVMSEFPMESLPLKEHFPQRNRIISGLSLGVVVVEAAQRSGALITARFALEQGREVFAVPGRAGDSKTQGVHRLLRDGAGLVESANDILVELQGPLSRCLPAKTVAACK